MLSSRADTHERIETGRIWILRTKIDLRYGISTASIFAKDEAHMHNEEIVMIGMRVTGRSRPNVVLSMMRSWRFFSDSFFQFSSLYQTQRHVLDVP